MISLLLVDSRCPRQEMAPGAATSIRRCLGEAYNEVLSKQHFRFFVALTQILAYNVSEWGRP